MTKKILTILLSALLIIGIFAGCSGNTDQKDTIDSPSTTTASPTEAATEAAAEGQATLTLSDGTVITYNTDSYPITEDDVTFSVWAISPSEDMSEYPILKTIAEGTGINPDWVEISAATAEERMSLMWASGEYPDVIVTTNQGSTLDIKYDTNVSEGVFLPLEEYMTEALMPNFTLYLQDFERDYITESDGHIYYFPFALDAMIGSGLAINTQWLDTLGLDMPNTPDEFYDVLVAFRDGDPNGNGVADEIPFSAELIWANTLDSLAPFFGAFGTCGGWQVDDDGKVFFGQVTDDYKEGILYLRKLYTEGLMDTEFFTQDMVSYKAKAQTDPVIYGSVIAFVYSAYTRSFTEEASPQYVNMLPLKNEAGDRLWASTGLIPSTIGKHMVVTSACEVPEIVARWTDFMYDPYIGFQIDSAPIEYAWTVTETGDNMYTWTGRTDVVPEGYESLADWRQAMHTNGLPRILTKYAMELSGQYRDTSTVIEKAYVERNTLYRDNCKLTNYMVMDAPTEEENETGNLYSADVETCWREAVAAWITGNGDVEAEWDDYVADMYDFGLQELIDVNQARYDRYFE